MTDEDPIFKKFMDNGGIRVSSILAMIPTKDAEGKWGYPIQQINQDVLQRKADLGTSIHDAIAAHAKGEFVPLNPKEEGYFDSYLKWENLMDLKPLEVEKRFYHDQMKLTGKVDMIGLIGQKKHVIDFKCTVSPDPVRWPIQGAFYEFLASLKQTGIEKSCLFVQLNQYGEEPRVYGYAVTQTLTSAAFSWYNAYTYLTNK